MTSVPSFAENLGLASSPLNSSNASRLTRNDERSVTNLVYHFRHFRSALRERRLAGLARNKRYKNCRRSTYRLQRVSFLAIISQYFIDVILIPHYASGSSKSTSVATGKGTAAVVAEEKLRSGVNCNGLVLA